MATVDEQSDPIFSDDDTSKPEDNDYNSDNSSADKNSHGKRVSLEETIRKIIQIEFENYLPYIIQQAKKCAPALAQDSDEEDVLDGPMEIDFVKKKEPTTSIASIKCKIKRLKIPAMALDSCAELPIITPDIVERVGYGIDKSIKHDLSGIATVPVESIGVVHNLPITLASGFTIYEDFIVVKYSKPMLIFSNPLLKKYKCAIDWDKDELKISHNGKDLIIPVTMHKVKNKLEMNCVTTTSECDESSILDQVDLSANETLKKNTFGTFDPSDIFATKPKKKAMTNVYTLKNINNKDNDSFKGVGQRLGGTYEQELKEKLYSAIKSKAEINDLSEKLVDKYNEREKEFENKASQLNASSTKLGPVYMQTTIQYGSGYLPYHYDRVVVNIDSHPLRYLSSLPDLLLFCEITIYHLL
ncbi:hypothetical protein RhiirA5_383603 [Rhizophagus irregularis]|uniref:Uncharacterized protein n=1 Tax=Rhizophagus irregularis TaxID=588596 RepID=A0A2N0NWD4_9GLOM|nr:hypothetical protein RhiirA5_383603 [Rhizophagus irregularis]